MICQDEEPQVSTEFFRKVTWSLLPEPAYCKRRWLDVIDSRVVEIYRVIEPKEVQKEVGLFLTEEKLDQEYFNIKLGKTDWFEDH